MNRVFLLCALIVYSLQIYAEGFQVNLQGQRQTGMGHTGTGLFMGASSMHFNPGALSFMNKKFEFSAGISPVFSKNTFQKRGSMYEAKSDNPVGTPLSFYGAAMINEKMAVGLAVTTPYGNSLKWGDEWDGKYLIQDISLQAIYIQPTFSYKVNEKLGLGIGFVVANGNVDLNKALSLQSSSVEGQVNLNGNTWAYGFNAGISYKATDKLSLGVNYRSKMVMKLKEGDASFTVPGVLADRFPSTTFKGELPMPANLVFGLGYQVNDKLLLAADLQYVEWSTYENLNFDFKDPSIPDSHNPREFENTLTYRLGAEYKTCEKLMIRAGIYYDNTPIPEHLLTPETPGTDKIGMSVGCSYQLTERLSFDASLLFIHGKKREDGYRPTDFYGTYYSNAVIPGFGINYSF